MNYDQLASFEPALAEFLEKIRHCFRRDKTFGYLQKYMLGLMADLKRKSIEPIALACGVTVHHFPYQRLIRTVVIPAKKRQELLQGTDRHPAGQGNRLNGFPFQVRH